MARAQIAHTLEEAVRRLVEFHRFQDDRGDLAIVLIEQLCERRQVIVFELRRELFEHVRDAVVRRGGADEPVVKREEWMFLWDCYDMASRVGPRQFHGGGRDHGSVTRELDHVISGQFQNRFGGLHFQRRRPGKVDAIINRRLDRGVHLVVRMAKRHGHQGHGPVDQAVAVGIPQACALAPDDTAAGAFGELVGSL